MKRIIASLALVAILTPSAAFAAFPRLKKSYFRLDMCKYTIEYNKTGAVINYQDKIFCTYKPGRKFNKIVHTSMFCTHDMYRIYKNGTKDVTDKLKKKNCKMR